MFICKKYCTHTDRVRIKPYLLCVLWAEIPSFKRKSLKVVFFWSELTAAYEDTLCYKDIFELNARISLIRSLFCALITCIYCIKNQPLHFNFVEVLWSPKCFGHSCGHLQGDFFLEQGCSCNENVSESLRNSEHFIIQTITSGL